MSINSEHIDITSSGGTFKGYFAAPDGGGPVPGVVVIQEIFGVNSHMRSVVERFAEAGYAALSPDLFWRIEPGLELTYTPDDVAKGREIRGKLDTGEFVEDVRAAFETLGGRAETQGRKLGLTGYCFGGMVAYLGAARLNPAATSSYYGGGIVNFLDDAGKIDAPIQFHFGEIDPGIPMSEVDQIKSALAGRSDAEVFIYADADHGFNCSDRGSYNEAAATQAWSRTMELFGQHLQ